MSLKKKWVSLLLLLSIFFMGGLAFANGNEGFDNDVASEVPDPDLTPDSTIFPPYPYQETGVYTEGNLGALRADWEASATNAFFTRNIHGGMTFGGAIGYQVNRWITGEIGSFYVPTAGFTVISNPNLHHRIQGFFSYPAAKLMFPLPFLPKLNLFAKGGYAYRLSRIEDENRSNDWRGMVALGAQYYLTRDFYTNVQWMHVGRGSCLDFRFGTHRSDFCKLPAYNLFLFGLGWRFTF